MKNTAIKIVSGVLVVALVVVAALAIAGVFNANTQNEVAFAEDDPSVSEQHMFRNFDANTVLYVRATDGRSVTGEAKSILSVVDNEYKEVNMVVDTALDAAGNKGFKPKDGWKEGMFYSVYLMSGYEFVNEEYKDVTSFMCIVKARESTDADTKLKEGVIMLEAGKFTVTAYQNDNPEAAKRYTLTVQGTRPAGEDLVFVDLTSDKVAEQKAYRKVAGEGQVKDVEGGYTLTVEDADVSDVYEKLYINKSYDVAADDITFQEEATEASLRSSAWYLAAKHYLYGEELDDSTKENKWIKVKFDPSFTPGSPSLVKLNITITFDGLFKDSDGNRIPNSGSIVIKIANTLTPVFDVHIQNEDGGKAFDVNLDLDVETTATIEVKYANSWSSMDSESNKLTEIANGLAKAVKKVTSEKLMKADGTAKDYIFAKWLIPIGALPITIEDNLGFELGASFAGEIGVLATNKFHATFGVVYAGKDLHSYHNLDDVFHFDNITLAGNAEARVGLINEVGISAYGTIAIDLGIHAGVYADLAGRLSLSGDDLLKLFKNEKSLNIIAAYYFETGIYAGLDVKGRVFGFNVAQKTLLDKKFPLFTAGHKYLPESFVESKEGDTIYMQNDYFYLVGWDVNAWDIQAITNDPAAMNLGWEEFDYEVGDGLYIDGNVVKAKTAGEFESTLTVTSKVNKGLSKTIKVVKNPAAPTTTKEEQEFDKANVKDVSWVVYANASKVIGVSVAGVALTKDQYEYDNYDSTLTIKSGALSGLSYGANAVMVESSKGYLKLVVRVINSAAVVADTTAKTFDKKVPGSLTWDMQLQGYDIESVKEGDLVVDAKYYNYRASAGEFVILASYLNGKAVGNYSFKVALSKGPTLDLDVAVVDSRAAKMNTVDYEFKAGSNEGLVLDVETYGNAANTIEKVTVGDKNYTTNVAVAPAEMFKDMAVGTTVTGYVTVGGKALKEFRVKIVASNGALVVPVKIKTFSKSSTADVEFKASVPDANGVTLSKGTKGVDYVVTDTAIVVKAAYLAKQNGEWTATASYQSSSVTLTVEINNDLMPALLVGAITVADNTKSVNYNLQDVDKAELVVEGLAADQYVLYNDHIDIIPTGLSYGTTVVTIYTPVNTLTLSVKREGMPTISDIAVIKKNEVCEAKFDLNTAHLEFDRVEVEGADITASQYRYSEGTLSLANEFVYNLAAGDYTVKAYLSEGVVKTATLKIQGEIPVEKPVGNGTDGNPYLIYTAEQLAAVASYVNGGNTSASYALMADIDMMGKTVEPIGTGENAYTGTFTGNGYTISNLSISEPVKVGKKDSDGYAIGMFGVLGDGSVVKDVRLNKVSVSFAKSGSVSAGIVAGRNAGTIQNVTILDGTVNAESKSWLDIKNAYFDLGAVVGYNNGGIIKNVAVGAKINGKVKGLNIMGLQITGRKSLINVGTVVGYFDIPEAARYQIRNIQVTASITCEADSNTINQNGWYGYSNLTPEEAAKCIKRVNSIG